MGNMEDISARIEQAQRVLAVCWVDLVRRRFQKGVEKSG